MKKVLTEENILDIFSILSIKIGFQESSILQLVHYWLTKRLHILEGRKWIYSTYRDWQKQFCFGIKRAFLILEKQDLLISGNGDVLKLDKTKWSIINYEKNGHIRPDSVRTIQSCIRRLHDENPYRFFCIHYIHSLLNRSG